MLVKKISLVPVLSDDKKYTGFLKKSMVLFIFQEDLFHYLNEPIKKFLILLEEKNYSSKSFKENLFFTPDNNLFDIFKKFIYTKG